MQRIGLLSDTHGFIDARLLEFFKDCDEIWHAGDIGNLETAKMLENLKPFRAVYGNIDGYEIRQLYPRHLRFKCEGIDVWITHIGGYPGHYEQEIKSTVIENPPKLFICGHSHILKVINDKKLGLLHINPGAAGKSGFHKVRTAIRFEIDQINIKELEILEIQRDI